LSVNRHLHALASAAGIPVNVVDEPDLCSFFMPSIVDRAPLTIAISSGGQAPVLARVLKARLESLVPAAYGQLAAFAGRWRQRVAVGISDPTNRRRFWEDFVGSAAAERVLSGDEVGADRLMDANLIEAGSGHPTGEVYLVGAGPGDPDLLTFRALRLMQQADVVLYDRLIGEGIINLVRRDAERIYVGKLPKEHTMPQDDISAHMVKLAREGKRVLRLKGGDPFTFGRGGEEIEALARRGIPFQVVPGITAAAGCAAYAGIPLTHRDHAQACVFVTGHGKGDDLNLNWPLILQPGQTVVVYMGLTSLGALTSEYMARGGNPDMPAAIVENGTRHNQRVVTGTIAALQAKAEAAGIGSPALIIIGSVTTLRDDLAWNVTAAETDEGGGGDIAPGILPTSLQRDAMGKSCR
jgi:uroporphyrin-III C-methyltransferase/precorrin-2 dehydrogenase/sirohydrochlorin ferrochelatase